MSQPTFTTKPPGNQRPKQEWKRWHKITIGSLLGFLVFIVLVAALAPAPEESATTGKATTASPAAEKKQDPVKFDRPDNQEMLLLRTRLANIEPRMNQNMDRYVSRSVATCDSIQHADYSKKRLEAVTVYRFQGGTIPDFSTAQARKVIEAVRDTFCDAPAKASEAEACPAASGAVLASVKFSAGGVEIDKSVDIKSGKSHYVAASSGSSILLLTYRDDEKYLSGMKAVNGTAKTQTDLPDGPDVIPAAGETALACIQ